MTDGKERLEPAGLSPVSRQRRRQRERRHDRDQLQRATVISALTAAAVMVGDVASVVAHIHTPHARRPIYEPRRLPWDEHEEDLEEGSSSRSSSSDDDTAFASKATRPTSDKGKGKDGGAGERMCIEPQPEKLMVRSTSCGR